MIAATTSGSQTQSAAEQIRPVAVSPELFAKYQSLIYREAGIWLAPHKTALLVGRLARRLRQLGMSNMREYFQLVTQSDQEQERALMIDCITTNETHFFREPKHFEFLTQKVFPQWKDQAVRGERTRSVRVWSAGCSTGEEPYSLAMTLLQHFDASEWALDIVATDISTRVLEKASNGTFAIEKAKQIPTDHLHAYMLKGRGNQHGLMKVAPEVQELVRFARLNLNAGTYPLNGVFDLIFCRNVLIYFDQESKKKVVNGLLRHLSPTGLLFVGHSESLNGISPALRTVVPTVYAPLSTSSVHTSADSR